MKFEKVKAEDILVGDEIILLDRDTSDLEKVLNVHKHTYVEISVEGITYGIPSSTKVLRRTNKQTLHNVHWFDLKVGDFIKSRRGGVKVTALHHNTLEGVPSGGFGVGLEVTYTTHGIREDLQTSEMKFTVEREIR